MNEMNRLRSIMLGISKPGVRIWRNNCGALKDADGRLIRFGVANPGGSDLIGWRSMTVTPDMVGSKVAVFLAIEVKGERGHATDPQKTSSPASKQTAGWPASPGALMMRLELSNRSNHASTAHPSNPRTPPALAALACAGVDLPHRLRRRASWPLGQPPPGPLAPLVCL